MGTASSAPEESKDLWWPEEQEVCDRRPHRSESSAAFVTSSCQSLCENANANTMSDERKRRNAQKLEEYRRDGAKKHAERREILATKKQEMMNLREELVRQKNTNEELKEKLAQYYQQHSCTCDEDVLQIQNENEKFKNENRELRNKLSVLEAVQNKCECNIEIDKLQGENETLKSKLEQHEENVRQLEELGKKNLELRVSIAETQQELQQINSEVLGFESERHDYQLHVIALKDVIRVSKQMLQIRESQLQELRDKISEIEASLAQHELITMSNDLKLEYEKQLRNIRYLRNLYEERQRVLRTERDTIKTQLEDSVRELEKHRTENTELKERVTELEKANSDKYDTINSLQSNLGLSQAECRGLQAEMSVINQLFSQILVGFNNGCQDVDLDKLIKVLEENHDLLTDIVEKEESSETSSVLPKVLLDLISRINKDNVDDGGELPPPGQTLETIVEEAAESVPSTQHTLSSAAKIVENLPKVWRVLTELLSHQNCPSVNIPTEDGSPEDSAQDANNYYKSVQTPSGPTLVLSVSKTYIRLKDLILEKKALEKETCRLKQLNGHLESRLQDQEKRLGMVSSELSKTWHVVGKMQRQHQQLHTHEKILCYELSQKRKLLNELKIELEYCREKWEQAREKNSTTEEQWKQLRSEFALRKAASLNDDLNNSAESGYSDEGREGSSDEEPGYETDVSAADSKAELPASKGKEDTLDGVESAEDETAELDSVAKETSPDGEEQTQDEDNLVVQKTEDESLHSLTVVQETKTDLVQNEDEKTTEVQTDDAAGTSTNTETEVRTRTAEEILEARSARLQRLEEQCSQLVRQVTNTSHRSIEICSKLDTLHEHYGNESGPSASTTAELPEVAAEEVNDSNAQLPQPDNTDTDIS